jgi:hypothetical protein
MKTYSQNGQDRVVVELFGGAKKLTFIELGAGNGKDLSNTLLLEEEYGWKGMLVEANPLAFQSLRINRPDTINVNALLWREEGQKLKFWIRAGWMSRIVDQEEVKNPPESRKVYRDYARAEADGTVIEMFTTTLHDVLCQYWPEHRWGSAIDFMSVDLEGAEDAVLHDFPYSDYLVRCLCIERPSKRLRYKLCEEGPYVIWGSLGEDTLFIHKESGLI